MAGGATCRPRPFHLPDRGVDVVFPDALTGWIVTAGGATLSAAGGQHVLATTNGQPLLATADGGTTWLAYGSTGWLKQDLVSIAAGKAPATQ